VNVAAAVAELARQQLGLRESAALLEYVCGATCSLDQYSCFLTRGQLEDVFSQIEGNFVGLGIELQAQDHALAIVGVIPGGPAAEAGVRVGDRIVEVDGLSVRQVTTDEAADLLKGPEGTAVRLTLLDQQNQRRQLRLVRRLVEVPSIEKATLVDASEGIGYMKLASFQKTTSRDFDEALWQLQREGLQVLIVDLRGNPGGLLTAAVEVADKFISAGSIVSTRGRNSHENFDYRAHAVGTWRVPLIVLIDGDTASASEIFAGAIRDSHRGTVIGQRSYGKGSVQGIFSLNASRAGVRLTTAKFYSPDGQPISNHGVQPDLVVRTANKPAGQSGERPADTADNVLEAAIEHARRQVAGQQQARLP
jgi:carboxyl-terminal processing protease